MVDISTVYLLLFINQLITGGRHLVGGIPVYRIGHSLLNGLYGGWLQNPAPVENGGSYHYLYRFQPSKVVQDFFLPPY